MIFVVPFWVPIALAYYMLKTLVDGLRECVPDIIKAIKDPASYD